MTTWYLDLDGGNDANDGLSFANRKKTARAIRLVIRHGDTVRLKQTSATKVPALVSGQNMSQYYAYSTTQANNHVFQLSADNHQWFGVKLAVDGWIWSGATGVTVTENTLNGARITATVNFSTFAGGKAAWAQLPAALNLSAYDALVVVGGLDALLYGGSLGWAQSSTRLRVCLCSDTAGNNIVNEFDLTGSSSFGLHPYCKITGALGSSIQSVAIYLDNPVTINDSAYFGLVSLVAAHESGILPGDLLYRNGASGMPSLVRMLYTNRVMFLENYKASDAGRLITTSLYKLRMKFVNDLTISAWTGFYSLMTNYAGENIGMADGLLFLGGRSGDGPEDFALIRVSGGWDTTNMSTQSGYTLCCYSGGASALFSYYGGMSYDRIGFHLFGVLSNEVLAENAPLYKEATDCPFLFAGLSKWDSLTRAMGGDFARLRSNDGELYMGISPAFNDQAAQFNGLGMWVEDSLLLSWNIYATGDVQYGSRTPFFATNTATDCEDIETSSSVAGVTTPLFRVAAYAGNYATGYTRGTSGGRAIGIPKSNWPSASGGHYQDGGVSIGLKEYESTAQQATISEVANELAASPVGVLGWLYIGTPGEYVFRFDVKSSLYSTPTITAYWSEFTAQSSTPLGLNVRGVVEVLVTLLTPDYIEVYGHNQGLTVYGFSIEAI